MSTTSSSPRKRRITGWSRVGAAVAGALALSACTGGRGEIYVTYFNGEYGLSLRHPAGWRTDQAEQDGVWYRYFLAPPEAPGGHAPVSVTLLSGATTASVEDYAQSYLAAHTVSSTHLEERQGVPGRSWIFASADGKTRCRLLLVAREGRVAGLYAQGDAAAMEKNAPTLDEIWASFTIERPELYPVRQWKGFQAALGIPASWRETRRFSGGSTLLAQYQSPPLALDKGRQTVHASLTVTLEQVPEGGDLQAYYDWTRSKLGDNFAVTNHSTFKGGYVDVMRTETPVTVSFVKRFYFAEAGRGCSLSFEAREDVFPRASRWADYIASTVRFGAAGGGAGR
jgi:hypothetical protein